MTTTPLPRSEFAVAQRYVYLNNASAGPLPRSSEDRIAEFVRAQCEAAVLGTFPHDLRMPEYRERIGNFIGASGSEIAIVVNTGAGANVIALGLDWNAGDEVLLCDNEFPANAVPWLALRRRGVEVRMLPTQGQRLTPTYCVANFRRARDWSRFRGFRMPTAIATTSPSSPTSRTSAACCFAWMRCRGSAPFRSTCARQTWTRSTRELQNGCSDCTASAFCTCGRGLLERLQLAMPGWRSVQNMWDFHNYEQPLSTQALKFEGGTPNLIGTHLDGVGDRSLRAQRSRRNRRHVLALTDRLCAGLDRLGAEIASLRGESTSSGIVTFRLPPHDSVALGEALQKEGIVTTYRSTGVRVSPHGYNTEEEIDRLLERLQCSLH